jgi:mannose-6-phosphate isomerase-like protein (cupin superfamily)
MLRLTVGDSLSRLDRDHIDFVRLLEKSDFDVGLYRPAQTDSQTPHARDEIYVIAAGSGEFVCEGERTPFGIGDAIFVAAGKVHRFEAFTSNFCAWVIFIGKRS